MTGIVQKRFFTNCIKTGTHKNGIKKKYKNIVLQEMLAKSSFSMFYSQICLIYENGVTIHMLVAIMTLRDENDIRG